MDSHASHSETRHNCPEERRFKSQQLRNLHSQKLDTIALKRGDSNHNNKYANKGVMQWNATSMAEIKDKCFF